MYTRRAILRTYSLVLFVAGLFETVWAISLEYSDGLSEPIPTTGTVAALIISRVLLARNRYLPLDH